MNILLGPAFNSFMIIICTIIGIIAKKFLNKELEDNITKVLGLVVIYIALKSMFNNADILNVLLSLTIGTIIGTYFNLNDKFEKLGHFLQNRLAKDQKNFADGFIEASLIFCVGSMAILGAIESGINYTHDILFSKGIIDGCLSIFIAAKKGISVALSGIIIFIYQGGLALMASFLKPFLDTNTLNHIDVVGGIILLSVGLNITGIIKMKSMNYVPSIIVTVVLCNLF